MTDLADLPPWLLASDTFQINGEECPGKCEVRGAGTPRKWDQRPGYGFSGAISVFTGNALSDFEIDVVLTTAQHLFDWNDFASKYLIKGPQGVRPTALGIYHPKLASLGIVTVVVTNLSQFTTLENGGEVCTISFQQYGKPLPMLKKPDGSIPGVAKAVPTAKDALDIELQKATAEFKSLSNQSDALGGILP
jgi:hypothetical protein